MSMKHLHFKKKVRVRDAAWRCRIYFLTTMRVIILFFICLFPLNQWVSAFRVEGLKQMHCGACKTMSTIKACCNGNCDTTTLNVDELLLISITDAVKLFHCGDVTISVDENDEQVIGTVGSETPEIVNRHCLFYIAKRCSKLQFELLVPTRSPTYARLWEPLIGPEVPRQRREDPMQQEQLPSYVAPVLLVSFGACFLGTLTCISRRHR